MASQTGKIASISTGRETLLIGPATEFGVGQRSLTLANSTSAELALSRFMMRQGARDLIRPHMRRWGLALSPTGSGGPADDVEILVRSVRSGALRIAMVPDVTLAFAGVGDVVVRGPPPTHRFPDDFVGRFTIVLDMAPNYLEGAAKTAFLETVEGVGKSAIIAGLATWIGVHFIPGVDIAALAFDLFFLGRDVIDACDKIANSFKAIRDAKSEVDLEPVAKVVAAALATLIVNGILKRILKLRKPAKGPAAKANAEAARQPRERREARRPRRAEEEGPCDSVPGAARHQPAPKRISERTRIYDIAESHSTATPRNGAAFYSGPGNREKALAAAKTGLVPIDNTKAGEALNSENLYNKFNPMYSEADGVWSKASRRYAGDASGHVTAYVEGASPDRVFAQQELPVLLDNEKVEMINGIPRKFLQRLESENPGAAFTAVIGNAPL